MADVLYIIDGVSGPKQKSSSLAQYQFCKAIVDNHDTTIISKQPVNEPRISGQCDCITVPNVYNYFFPVMMPLFVFLHIVKNWRRYDVYTTNQTGDAILSILLLSIFSIDWVILSTDSPDGAHIRGKRRGKFLSLDGIYSEILYRIAVLGFHRCDQVILSDETNLIPDNKKTVIKGGADCSKIQRIAEEEGVSIPPDGPGSDPVRILYVGNMYIHRGIDILFEAVDAAESEVELVLVGPRPPEYGRPENVEEFQAYFAQGFEEELEALDAKTKYKGVLDHEETIQEMLHADIGICILPYERGLPHFKTSYPIKIFEYMATGLPILCTRTPAMEELLTDPQLLDSHNHNAIADDIERIATDSEIRSTCAVQNIERIEPHCWDRLIKEILEAFTI